MIKHYAIATIVLCAGFSVQPVFAQVTLINAIDHLSDVSPFGDDLKNEYDSDEKVETEYRGLAQGTLINTFDQVRDSNPVPDGLINEYYSDGKVETSSHYKNGKLNGLTQKFDQAGVLREEINYVDGIEEGEHKQYDNYGKLQAKWSDRNGKRDGVYQGYFADGKLAEERRYADGILLDAQGNPYNGPYLLNFSDGKPYKKLNFKNGLADGIFEVYSETGFLVAKITYVNDKMEGPAFHYDETTGRLVGEYQMVGDKRQGLGKSYNSDGGWWETMFVDDVAQGVAKFYDAKGSLRSTVEIKDGEEIGKPVFFDSNGKAFAKAHVLEPEMNKGLFFVLWFVVFLFSLTVHEAAHAWSALKLGDDTAYKGGQVTINPLPHIRREPIGTIVLPILTYWGQGWMLGWASAPYNPQWALAHPRRSAVMALAGPLSNLLILILAGIAMRIGLASGFFTITEEWSATALVGGVSDGSSAILAAFLSIMFFLNLVLFGFNLLPFPPLDGSALPLLLLPHKLAEKYMGLMNQPGLVVFGLFVAWKFFDLIAPILFAIFMPLLFLGLG